MREKITLFLLCTISVVLAEKQLAAVMSLRNDGGLSEGEINIITERIEYVLSQSGAYKVVNRRDVKQILDEQGFQQSGVCNDDACVVEMGQLLAAEKMFAGSIGKMGSLYSFSLKVYDVRTGAITAQTAKDIACNKENLLSKHIPTSVNDLLKAMDLNTVAIGDISERPLLRRSVFWVPVSCVVVCAGGLAILLGTRGGSTDATGGATEITVAPPSRY